MGRGKNESNLSKDFRRVDLSERKTAGEQVNVFFCIFPVNMSYSANESIVISRTYGITLRFSRGDIFHALKLNSTLLKKFFSRTFNIHICPKGILKLPEMITYSRHKNHRSNNNTNKRQPSLFLLSPFRSI